MRKPSKQLWEGVTFHGPAGRAVESSEKVVRDGIPMGTFRDWVY